MQRYPNNPGGMMPPPPNMMPKMGMIPPHHQI